MPALPVLLLPLLVLLPALPAPAADFHPQAGRVEAGRVVELDAGGETLAAIARAPDRPRARGGVLLLAGAGEHANAAGTVGPLRRGLADAGWLTLAIASTGDREANDARIRAGLDWLVERLEQDGGRPFLVLGGSGHGAAATATWLAENRDGEPAVGALVAVNALVASGEEGEAVLRALQALEVPVLDIYGDAGRREVVTTAEERARRARAGGNDAYRQDRLQGLVDFRRNPSMLNTRVAGWLGTAREEAAARARAAERRRAEREAAGKEPEEESPEEKEEDQQRPDDLERYFTPPGGNGGEGQGGGQ
ncbi:MAG: DUF3530 family protein [Pseudomonadota bacterium]